MEDLLTRKISLNAGKGRQAMEWVINTIDAEVKDLTKSTDEILNQTKKSIGDITSTAKKSMDDISQMARKSLGDIHNIRPGQPYSEI